MEGRHGQKVRWTKKMKVQKSIFGQVIAKAREDRGLTQAELAVRLNLDQRTISGVENGDREPRLSTVLRYARALGIRSAELVEAYEQALEKVEEERGGRPYGHA